MTGWTCPQCGVNYSPNVIRCPCTEKKNQEPPKLHGIPLIRSKELDMRQENKEHA